MAALTEMAAEAEDEDSFMQMMRSGRKGGTLRSWGGVAEDPMAEQAGTLVLDEEPPRLASADPRRPQKSRSTSRSFRTSARG